MPILVFKHQRGQLVVIALDVANARTSLVVVDNAGGFRQLISQRRRGSDLCVGQRVVSRGVRLDSAWILPKWYGGSLSRRHRIGQHADAFDGDVHSVAGR